MNVFSRLKLISVFFLLLFSISTYAQRRIEGVVIEKKTGKLIPYASVTLIKEKISVSAGEKATFKLESTSYLKDDTLLVTAVGFRSLKIPVALIGGYLTCDLEENVQLLNEVKIIGKKRRQTMYVLDTFSPGELQGAFKCSHSQIARLFETKREFAVINTIKFARFYTSDIFHHGYERAKFRIRIYDVDASGLPGKDLCKVIEVNDTIFPSVKTLNLRARNIIIPQKKFFIAIEWERTAYNEHYVLKYSPVSI